jgi:hypothetical protein
VNTSHERNVQIWSSTADTPSQLPARVAPAGAHAPLTSSARWNVVMLFGSGLASTVFFLAALLTDSLSYAGPSFAVKNPLSVSVSAPHAILQPTATAPATQVPRRASRRNVRKADVARVTGPTKPSQSRFARLVLGDGSLDVQPFPRPSER